MFTHTTDGIGELKVKQDSGVRAYPFEFGFRRAAFKAAVDQMISERQNTPLATEAPQNIQSTTVEFRDGLDDGGLILHGRTDDGVDGSSRIQLNASATLGAYENRASRGKVDWKEFNASAPVKAMTVTTFHEASHHADNVVMGRRAAKREYFAHENRYTRKFRLPALVGLVAVMASIPAVRTYTGELVHQIITGNNRLIATVFMGVLAAGIGVAGRVLDRGIHSLARRSAKCQDTQPGEIRAEAAAEDYRKRMEAGEAPAIVTVGPKEAN